jgi:catechol 2,3-dioxygenase-like lactoylglutathione lyase family enzyme
MPLGHLGLNVPDLTAAKTYYDQVMPALGYTTYVASDQEIAYMPAEGKRGAFIFLYPSRVADEYSRDAAGLQHLAFMAPTRSSVRAVHEMVTGLGATVLYEPQEFPQYGPTYFATFWLDPFGFNLEAVCHHDRD